MAEIKTFAVFMIVNLVLTCGFPFGSLNSGATNPDLSNLGMTGGADTGSLLGMGGTNTGNLLGIGGGTNIGNLGSLLGLEGAQFGEQQANLFGMPFEPSGQLAMQMMGLSNNGMPIGGAVPRFLRVCDKIWSGCSTVINFILRKLGGPVGIANRMYNRAIDNYSKKHGVPRGEAAGEFNEVMESRLAGSFLG